MLDLKSIITKKVFTSSLINSLVILFFVISFSFNFLLDRVIRLGEQQYSSLAESFLQGKLYFWEESKIKAPMTNYDVVEFKGKIFWPLGLFPAVVLMPFVYVFGKLGVFFRQSYLNFFMILGIFYLAKKIAQKLHYSETDSVLLAFAFCFASVFQVASLVSWSFYFVQATSVFLVLLAIVGFLNRRQFILIGILFSFVLLSRITAALGIIFFFLVLFLDKKKGFSYKFKNSFSLVIPMLTGFFLFFGYNYARFGNVFDNGYIRTLSNKELAANSDFTVFNDGLFNLSYIKNNFYNYFLRLPSLPFLDVQFPGVSFFVVSPVFLYIFRAKLKEPLVKASLLTIFLILPFLLSYYWPGWRQVGPRYLLDVLPFAYILLLYSFKKFKLTPLAKLIIIASSLLDLWLFYTAFEDTYFVS